MQLTDQTLSDVTEVLDDNQYTGCRFERCQLVYRGGKIPTIVRCHFENCKWQFEDAAERTLLFMKQIYNGMGPGGAELIDATLEMIRSKPEISYPQNG